MRNGVVRPDSRVEWARRSVFRWMGVACESLGEEGAARRVRIRREDMGGGVPPLFWSPLQFAWGQGDVVTRESS